MNIGRETETIEFKKSTAEKDSGIISIASILNKHDRGILYFGVLDSGDVCGMDVGRDTLRSLSRDIASSIRPSCWYEINERKTSDGLSFIEVQFSGDNSPYSAFGRYYERFADEDRMISDVELERLFRGREKNYSFWENEDSGCSLDDVDENLLSYVIKCGNEAKRLGYMYSDKSSALSKFGLLCKCSGNLNNAGNVLFSKNKPVLVKMATFATDSKDTFIKLNHFYGNVFEVYEESVSYIMGAIDWKIGFTGGLSRKEEPEIPAKAIREIVLNAFAHGCYFGRTSFEIDVYKNRVCIYSPGLFPIGFTPEEFASGQEQPIVHNPKIVDVLFRTASIEAFGTGFERTFEECRRAGVSYGYENTKNGFRFTFMRPLSSDGSREMSKSQKAVYDLVRKDPYMTGDMISEKVGKSPKTVYRALKDLKDAGKIRRIGSDYDGHWEILD